LVVAPFNVAVSLTDCPAVISGEDSVVVMDGLADAVALDGGATRISIEPTIRTPATKSTSLRLKRLPTVAFLNL
jgi:hypothetical protein